MAELQSDRYERGYFHKIWMESTIAWVKLMHLVQNHRLSSTFIRCQNPYQLQNLKILLTILGTKTDNGEIFGI